MMNKLLEAMMAFQKNTGVALPHNLDIRGGPISVALQDYCGGDSELQVSFANHFGYGGFLTPAQACVLRSIFTAWLSAIAANPGRFHSILKLVKKNTSPKGQGAFRTKINLWEVLLYSLRPEALEKALSHVMRRARLLCAPFGHTPSWYVVYQAVCLCRNYRRAAFIAAAMTVSGGACGTYRSARAVLEQKARARDYICPIHFERPPRKQRWYTNQPTIYSGWTIQYLGDGVLLRPAKKLGFSKLISRNFFTDEEIGEVRDWVKKNKALD